MDGNKRVADFIWNISWNDLPEEVHQKVKLCLLDTLGATIGGTLTPVSKITANYITKLWPGNEATILLYNAHSSAAGAAFANGYALPMRSILMMTLSILKVTQVHKSFQYP